MLLGIIGTTSVILPAFLTGAMAVQVRASLDLSESDFGLAIGAFFVGSACGSAVLGRLAERLGPRLAVRIGLTTTIVANLAIATIATDARSLQFILLLAGLANTITQPAINLLLVRVIQPERLGFVMALKQSGMPSASLLGGLAVPAIALTVGWRAAYVCAVVFPILAIWLSNSQPKKLIRNRPMAGSHDDRLPPSPKQPTPDQGWVILTLMAAVGVLGGGAANVIVGYLVSGAVDAGIEPGPAGLLLTLGSGLGIASRLWHGWLVDRRKVDVLARVMLLFGLGALGTLALALKTPVGYLLGTPIAFAAGWAWPGLFNLVVVRANQSAPAAATGVTQTGVYVGSLISPVLAGFLIERSGYAIAWILTACSLAGAAALAGLVRFGMNSSPSNSRGREVEPTSSSG